MNCKEFQERLLEPTILAGLDQDPEASAHANACAECRQSLEWNRKIAGGFTAMADREPPSILRDRVLKIPEMMGSPEVSPQPAKEPESMGFPGWRWLSGMGLTFAGAFLLYALVLRPIDNSMTQRHEAKPASVDMRVSTPPVPALPPAEAVAQTTPGSSPAQTDTPAATLLAGAATSSERAGMMTVAQVPTSSSITDSTVLANQISGPVATESFQVALAPREMDTKSMPEAAPAADQGKAELTFVPPPPTVVGEPLNSPPPAPSVAAPPAQPLGEEKTQPSLVLARVSKNVRLPQRFEEQKSSFPQGEILLREAAPEAEFAKKSPADLLEDEPLVDAAAANEQFARDFQKQKGETATMVSGKALPSLESRREKVLAVVLQHPDKVVEGPIDLNQWILAGWITVRERLDLSAPSGKAWVTRKESGEWKVDLEPASGR